MRSALASTYTTFPFEMRDARDVWVHCSAGRKYLDFYGGHAVSLLGHSPEPLIEALVGQARNLYFYSTLGPMATRERAARALLEYGPSDFSQVFFCNSGAEANETALKLCLQKRQRPKLVSFRHGWHGRSLLCMSVTDDRKWHDSLPGRCGPTGWAQLNDVESLSEIDEDTAGVILEPIQSLGGVREATLSFLQALRERCDKVGAWLIFDEIQTGLGRTGVPFVSGSRGVCPDIMTLAKGLGSGYPMGAVVMTGPVADTLRQGDLGSTFGGGPMAMAVLERSLQILASERLAEHAADIGSYISEQVSRKCHVVEEVRGRGCLIGLKARVPAKILQERLLSAGILAGTSNDPSVLRLLPPLTIQKEHVDELVSALASIQEG